MQTTSTSTPTRTLPFPPSPFSLTKTSNSQTLLYAEFPALSNGTPSGSCSKTIPIFNTDRQYFTPCFILGYDRRGYANGLWYYQVQFQRKVTVLQQDKLKIFVPRPSLQNSYCCVCMTTFQDYLEHTALPSHQQQLRNNPYHHMIGDLCLKFQQHTKTEVKVEQGKIKGKQEVVVGTASYSVKKEGIHVRKTRQIAKMNLRKKGKDSCGEESIGTLEAIIVSD